MATCEADLDSTQNCSDSPTLIYFMNRVAMSYPEAAQPLEFLFNLHIVPPGGAENLWQSKASNLNIAKNLMETEFRCNGASHDNVSNTEIKLIK